MTMAITSPTRGRRARVTSLERSDSVAIVALVGGEELRLDDDPSAVQQPIGVVVVSGGGGETFVPWRALRRIDLAR